MENSLMKRFAITVSSALLVTLAACQSTPSTTAPGAVGASSSCCKENKAASCTAAKAECAKDKAAGCADKAAAPAAQTAAPGAVSGQKKAGCGATCPMSAKSSG
jgi:hypothetical protein